jgi:hypothetical protein
MDNSVGLSDIREHVKRLAHEGRSKNALIAASSGPDRHVARQRKQGVGATARVFLLAYAMLRGIPYVRLERTTKTPSWRLGHILDEVSGVVAKHRPGTGETEVTEWFRGHKVSP